MSWEKGDIVSITAGTGCGKSYFIKNTLYDLSKQNGKRILMLIHRRNCVRQFKEEIKRDGKEGSIVISTYQQIESGNKNFVNMSTFDYIVCDEFHYFLSDSSFNRYTDISFKKIMSQQHAILIMMSATAWDIQRYIENKYTKKKIIPYSVPKDFSFIRSLTFFNKTESLGVIAQHILNDPSKCKGAFFVQSAKQAYGLYHQFKRHSMFCRGGNDTSTPFDRNKLKELLINEKFNDRLLFTTACLDAGVNIVDPSLTKIVVQMDDLSSLLQCIGRKRIQNQDDKIDLYIQTVDNNHLLAKCRLMERKIEMARYLKEFGSDMYIEKYYKEIDPANIIYDEKGTSGQVIKVINEMMYYKINSDINEYRYMLSLGKYGYCARVARLLDMYDESVGEYKYKMLPENYNLETYLEENVHKYLYTTEAKGELIRLLNTVSGKQQLKSLAAVNISLVERRLKYRVVLCDVKHNEKRFRYAWKIERR